MASGGTWFVYMLECASGRIYTGATPDVPRRMRAHEAGRGARFTRMDPPRQLLAARAFASKGDALSAELAVKRLHATQKRELAGRWRAEADGCGAMDMPSAACPFEA